MKARGEAEAGTARPDGLDELARLMETFNQATEKLGRSYQTIAGLQKELAEKDRQLSRKTRLEMLGRLAATLAHEIRNPLGGIQLYASMLRRDLEADAEKSRTLDRILGAVAGLDRLVEDMLAYGRDVEPERVRRPLGPILDTALDLARGSIEEKSVKVVREGTGGEAEVDAAMLQRALLNLVLNAVQAMPPGGTLTAAAEGRELRIADSGPGIAPEILEKLFTPFVTSKTQGTGLGLAIVHKIVESHGGVVEARNRPEGGAVFSIRL
jgi:two-component system, sporulation sensor kinase E